MKGLFICICTYNKRRASVNVRIISDVHGGKLEWWLGDHSPGPSHEPIVDKYTRLIIAKNVSAPVVVNTKGNKQLTLRAYGFGASDQLAPSEKIVRDVKETAGVADGKLDFGVVAGGSCSSIRVSLCATQLLPPS